MDWDQLRNEGWEKKNNFYVTQSNKGVRRKFKSVTDLHDNEKHLSSILFPTNVNKTSQPKQSQESTSQCEGSKVFDIPETQSKPSKVEQAACALIHGPDFNSNLDEQLDESVIKLRDLCASESNYSIDARTIIADIILALSSDDNPFKRFPWDVSQNIFSTIINFALKYTPGLLRDSIRHKYY